MALLLRRSLKLAVTGVRLSIAAEVGDSGDSRPVITCAFRCLQLFVCGLVVGRLWFRMIKSVNKYVNNVGEVLA